jgi:hypothetical protein
MSAFSAQAALCYALLGGISAAALLSSDANKRTSPRAEHPATSALSQLAARALGSDWAERCAPPLWCASVFFNLQGLMSSLLTLAHANSMPDAGIGALVRAMPISLHAVGWLLVPAVGTLSGALVCSADMLHGPEAGLAAAVGVAGLGTATMLPVVFRHAATFCIRRKLPALPPDSAQRLTHTVGSATEPWRRRAAARRGRGCR